MTLPATAVVTGASRGIGLAVSRALAERGTRVAMLARSGGALAAAAEQLGGLALAMPCDVSDHSALDAVIADPRRIRWRT